MCSWTIDEVTTYFESGGHTMPLRAANLGQVASGNKAAPVAAKAQVEAEERDRALALRLQEAEDAAARKAAEQARRTAPAAPLPLPSRPAPPFHSPHGGGGFYGDAYPSSSLPAAAGGRTAWSTGGARGPAPPLAGADRAAQEALELERAIQQSIQSEQRAERQRQLDEAKALEEVRRREEEERKAQEMAALRERSAINERRRAEEERARQHAAAAAAATAKAVAYDSDGGSERSVQSTSTSSGATVETGGAAAAPSAVAGWASVDALAEALGRLPAALGGGGGGGEGGGDGSSAGGGGGGSGEGSAVRTGMAVGEWANCELLMPLLAAALPSEAELEALGIVLLDIPTAQLLKLADADQQCEAVIDGPQCAGMRRRMADAKLILAVINDNDDPELMDGGRHWSVIAMRREAWRGGVCVLEHYDPSGDPELNCDAAQQLASSLAERLSEIRKVDADRIEVWRMAAPVQHDPDVCGLTALAFLRAIVDAFVEASSPAPSGGSAPASPSKGTSGAGDAPRTPAAVAKLTWREVEALRQAAARVWAPQGLEAAEAYAAELSSRARPTRHAANERHVVFDLHDEEEEEDNFDELEEDHVAGAFLSGSAMQSATKGGGGASTLDVPLYDFLQAVGLGAMGGVLGRTGLTLEGCAEAVGRDRTQFLADLRDAGVTKLADRQGFANALGKAKREGWLRAPYKGPFTAAGRELRNARAAQPNQPAPHAASAVVGNAVAPNRAHEFMQRRW